MDLNLKGRVAFVTGATRGIGEAIATAFAREAVHLALFGRDYSLCEEVARKIGDAHPGVQVIAVKLDFEEPPTIRLAVESAVKRLGGVDILVNCAGGSSRGWLDEIPDDAWERWFRVKPIGLARMTRETLPYLKKSDQARVINISGNRGREPQSSVMGGPINLGTLSLTKALANQFGPLGITVNAIAPGFTRTRRWTELVAVAARERGVPLEAAEQQLVSQVPMGRIVEPHEVADLAVFLASARAGMITGTAINIDGGTARSI